jgi:membrane associated rhomboid family serine protease
VPAATRESSLSLVSSWIALLWLIFIADVALRHVGFFMSDVAGLRPHSLGGLWGVLGSHLLHANLAHISANSIALLILGWLSTGYSRVLTAWAVVYSALVAGAFTWLIGDPLSVHVGASGVLYGLIGFLVMNGLVRKGCLPLLIAIPVGALFWLVLPAMLPTAETRVQMISWEMHLGGFVGGAIASWQLRKQRPA